MQLLVQQPMPMPYHKSPLQRVRRARLLLACSCLACAVLAVSGRATAFHAACSRCEGHCHAHAALLLITCAAIAPASTVAPTDRPAPNAVMSPSAAADATARAAPSTSPAHDVSATMDTASPAAVRCFSGSCPHMSGHRSAPAAEAGMGCEN